MSCRGTGMAAAFGQTARPWVSVLLATFRSVVVPKLLQEIRRRAADDDRSVSSWIRRAVEHELQRPA